MTGPDSRDEATHAAVGHAQHDYRPYLRADGLRGARIGVMRNFFGFDARVDAIVEESILAMRSAGIDGYLASLGEAAPMKTLGDLIAFNEANAATEMPYFGQEIFIQAQAKGPLTDKAYVEARRKARRLSRTQGLDAAFRTHRIDALVAPSGGTAWLTDLIKGDSGTGGSAGPAAVAGYPSITVPAGFIFGLPVGLSFIGPAWSEPTLIGLAYAFEQATNVRRAPEFLPSALVG